MRDTFVGMFLGTALTAFAVVGWQTQPPAHGQGANADRHYAENTVVTTVPFGEGGQRVVVYDKQRFALAVYEIDAGGRVALRSVRQLQWDLALEEFNTLQPKPTEVRAMMGGR